jgi:signal transduction histidine kinase/ligand-binding sensor domain-containing protein
MSNPFLFSLRIALTAFLLCGLSRISFAQSFSFKHYTVEDGLNTSTVYYATQDLQGNMWFATEQGVCKFDGRTFTRYTINDGLSDNEVLYIKTDSRGRVWFMTLNGHLSYYQKGKFCNEGNTPWLKKTYRGSSYTNCFESSDHKLFLGSTVIENDSDILATGSTGGCSYFENDKKVNIYWADTLSYSFDGHKYSPINLKYRCTRANCMSYIKGNEFYVSDPGLILKNNSVEQILIPPNDVFISISVTGVTLCRDSSFILTTRNGVLWYPPNTFDRKKARKLLAGKVVYSLFIDNENNYWFCTAGDGIYMLPSNQGKVLNYTIADGLKNEVINRVLKDENGNIWLACNNSVITKISGSGILNIDLEFPKPRNARVLDIAIDHKGNLYAATDLSIIKLTAALKQEAFLIQYPDNVRDLYASKTVFVSENDSLTVTVPNGIYKLRRYNGEGSKNILKRIFKSEIYYIRTYTHYIDKQNNLWVATIKGLSLKKGDELEFFIDKDSLLSKRITNIAEMPDSTLVLSTEGYGIVFFKDGKIINRLNESNGLSSNVCRRLFVRGNTLWVSTFAGLTKCTYKNNVISDIHIFNTNNGLLSNSVKDVYDDGEKVYVATEKGLCVMENPQQEMLTPPPPLSVTEVDYSGEKFLLADSIFQFKTNNSFKINFVAPTFQNPAEVKYRYRIPKLGSDWIETKNNSVEYSLNGSGKYDFEVQAKKVNSGWSKTAGFSFIMIPPFYKTTWFYIIMLAAAGFIIYYITRFITQQRFQRQLALARQNELIEHERMRIASDMHDDIGADLTQISIWTNILKATNRNEVVDKIVTSSNDVLQKVDSIIWALDSVHDHAEDLISYVRQYALNYLESSDISFSLEASHDLPDVKLSATQRRNIFLVIKELLHNTVKHSGALKVTMQFTYSSPQLIINYADNGKGFDASAIGDGLGFTTLEKRMAEINSTFTFTTSPGNGFSAEMKIKI